MADDEKLAQVNHVRLLPVKTIGNNIPAILKNHRSILTRKPVSHPLLKLWLGHLIPVSLVSNQLVIKSGE